MEAPFLIYIGLSVIISIILSSQTDRKLLAFFLLLFIFVQPVLSHIYTIDLPGLPFDLQPNRILLFVMLFFLLSAILSKRPQNNNSKQKFTFEIFLYTYFTLVIFSLSINCASIELKNLIAVPAEILLFIFVYHVLKSQATPSLFEVLIKAIVILSVISAIVGIYQLLLDPSFLKLCPPRNAFGNLMRSTAVFVSEQEFGYFINFAIIVFLVRYSGRPLIFITIPLLVLALASTFHRMSWIIFLVTSSAYLILLKKHKTIVLSTFVTVILSCIILMSYFAEQDTLIQIAENKHFSSFAKDRLLQNTVTGRMGRIEQFIISAQAISKHFMGLGGYENKEYYNLMAKHDMIKSDNIPLVVHNGFLTVGIKYGVLAMIAFSGFIISILLYFKKHISFDRPITVYPFFIVLIWFLSNMSNNNSSFRFYFVILVAIVCGSFVSFCGQNNS